MELKPSNDEVSKGNNNWFNKDIQLGILLIQLQIMWNKFRNLLLSRFSIILDLTFPLSTMMWYQFFQAIDEILQNSTTFFQARAWRHEDSR